MPLSVHTCRVGFVGIDALQITRYGQTSAVGLIFAPSREILEEALAKRKSGKLAEHWPQYVGLYTEEMRQSFRTNRSIWENLLKRESVTLLCYCTDQEHCHRTILARDILPKLGASYVGERPPPAPRPNRIEVTMSSRLLPFDE